MKPWDWRDNKIILLNFFVEPARNMYTYQISAYTYERGSEGIRFL